MLANTMTPVFANAGVPMLFVQMPFLLVSLPVIIAIEAVLCRRWLGLGWKQAWSGSAVANGVSTIFGFPILWVALIVVQMIVGGGKYPRLPEPWF